MMYNKYKKKKIILLLPLVDIRLSVKYTSSKQLLWSDSIIIYVESDIFFSCIHSSLF